MKSWNALSLPKKVLVVVGVLVLLLILASRGATPTSSPTPVAAATASAAAVSTATATTTAPTVAPTATPTPAPTAFTFGDGTYTVPAQIKPGTYRTREKQPGSCYWARLSGFGGSIGELLSNELTSEPTVATILETDKGFQSRGCARFSANLSAITKSPTDPLPAGTYIVGTDVAPGTWSATPPAGGTCYWARLSGFSGGIGEVISNDLPKGPTIVTIAPTDKGFSSKGCGNWTKSG